MWANRSLKRVTWRICLFFESESHFCSFALKKRAIHSIFLLLFSTCFLLLFPFLSPFMPKNKLHSSLFKKEWLWANRSRRSFKKSDRERSAISLFRSQKTSDSLQKPKREILTLLIMYCKVQSQYIYMLQYILIIRIILRAQFFMAAIVAPDMGWFAPGRVEE